MTTHHPVGVIAPGAGPSPARATAAVARVHPMWTMSRCRASGFIFTWSSAASVTRGIVFDG